MAQNLHDARGVKILSAQTPDQLEKLIADFMSQREQSGRGPVRSIQYQTAVTGFSGAFRPIFTAMLVY